MIGLVVPKPGSNRAVPAEQLIEMIANALAQAEEPNKARVPFSKSRHRSVLKLVSVYPIEQTLATAFIPTCSRIGAIESRTAP